MWPPRWTLAVAVTYPDQLWVGDVTYLKVGALGRYVESFFHSLKAEAFPGNRFYQDEEVAGSGSAC